MQYRARGKYGVAALLEVLGCRVLRTNSGESSFMRWVRNRCRQGATPMLDGVVTVVDMMRVRCRRRVADEVAMVNDALNWSD
jgi:hypothetical protein